MNQYGKITAAVCKDVFRTIINIYDEAFFAKISNDEKPLFSQKAPSYKFKSVLNMFLNIFQYSVH